MQGKKSKDDVGCTPYARTDLCDRTGWAWDQTTWYLKAPASSKRPSRHRRRQLGSARTYHCARFDGSPHHRTQLLSSHAAGALTPAAPTPRPEAPGQPQAIESITRRDLPTTTREHDRGDKVRGRPRLRVADVPTTTPPDRDISTTANSGRKQSAGKGADEDQRAGSKGLSYPKATARFFQLPLCQVQDDGRRPISVATVLSSRSSSIASLQDQVDSAWQLVNVDKTSKTGPKQPTTVALPPIKRHRRGQTEGPKRLSMFRSRPRTNTVSNHTMGHRLSPSVSTNSSNVEYEVEDKHPQSGWSDSDHEDSPTKSWVARGSKMLKKQNSKFALSSTKNAEAMEQHGPASEDQSYRNNSKHGRMWSTGNGVPNRPQISQPYNFQHLTHTHARHFSAVRSASHDKLATEFSAIHASQPPRKELRGIRVADIRSRPTEPSCSVYEEPITPPLASSTKSRTSRSGSILSIGNPRTICPSRSVDNFSQPSPKTYRFPRSPTSPPPRTSSRNAAPDFFSDQHHATVQERELLSRCEPSMEQSPSISMPECSHDEPFDDVSLPHAITTPDDVAFTLQPPLLQRSTLALADVPEEDELHAAKRASMENSRPMTADSTLRHAKSFPTNRRSKHKRNASSSSKSIGRPDSVAIDASSAQDAMNSSDVDESVCAPNAGRKSRRSEGIQGTGTCWQDAIDYCYQLEAEADCDFEWDRVSMNDMRPADETKRKQTSAKVSRESAESLCRSYEMLRPHKSARNIMDENARLESGNDRLPRLQTSLPDLEFSAASSAKSSMASLRGPITPLQQVPLPGKNKTALSSSKSTDTLNLDSSFFIAHDCEVPWSYDDSFQSRDHTSVSSQKSNLVPHRSRKNSSARSSGPLLSRYPSSESMMLSNSTSSISTRGTTASGGSLKEIACSKNYRQHMEITTKQIADRLAALSVEDSQKPTWERATNSKHTSNEAQHPAHRRNTSQVPADVNKSGPNTQGNDAVSGVPHSSRTEDQAASVASFAKTPQNDLLSLRWPSPPRNVLLVEKKSAPNAREALKTFACHIHDTYPDVNILCEPTTASEIHQSIPFPVHTELDGTTSQGCLANKVDLTATFGGDGTILRASSLFATAVNVPPILSFSMGTLGFLGEWKFEEFKRAFREVYMAGAGVGERSKILEGDGVTKHDEKSKETTEAAGPTGWSSIRGKNLGNTRGARVLLRNRLKVAVHTSGTDSPSSIPPVNPPPSAIHAMNEIIIHRGATPHLAHIAIFIGGRFLTEAVADGMIISTPTGSTAYSLSSGGSIIHPLVDSLCLTPICPRSLSFRPLVLPASTPVTLRLSEENNRGREVEVSIDGVRQEQGLKVGGEIRVVGEEILRGKEGWRGGVPCIMREGGARGDEDGWVGGLNGLLKFNYPFGEEG
ncbi:MAG: hypothetical protein Q9169_005939 [Polycauliona sp. 2 TL-2023]